MLDLLTTLETAIFYWQCNLPKDAGPTELEDLAAARQVRINPQVTSLVERLREAARFLEEETYPIMPGAKYALPFLQARLKAVAAIQEAFTILTPGMPWPQPKETNEPTTHAIPAGPSGEPAA